MNYNLNTQLKDKKKTSAIAALAKLLPLIKDERRNIILALGVILVSSGLNLAAPILIGHTIDRYISTGQYHGVLVFSGILLGIYLVSLVAGYIQTKLMGGVGQRMLYTLRNTVFDKLQSLPVAFFNQNKAGDLISRINNDTDKLNQFFSQSLMQFMGSIFIMVGAGIFLLSINLELGLASLAPAAVMLIFTRIVSPWVKRKNAVSLTSVGGLSAEIQESINNFKVVVAFNRRDYFRNRFSESNNRSYQSAVSAGIANNIFTPVYGFAANLAQLITLALGIYFITQGNFTIGLLISFISYVSNFYNPLRQLAALWANFQVAMAGWDRISDILSLESNLQILPATTGMRKSGPVLAFDDVSFVYENDKEVLRDVSFTLDQGKTYALIGPTGGGKTTTASLMARLYDPTAGTVYLEGRDIRSYSDQARTDLTGFILQDPFLFNGTLRENILYGNTLYANHSAEAFDEMLKESGMHRLLERFDQGLDTVIETSGDAVSLGQKQLIAFIRAVLRRPKILILDEATANVDTITEQLLESVLDYLPPETTRVIIAHRLNTIENADAIFFINAGAVVNAGTMAHAVDMLLHEKRES